jgi:hypothetical protein
MRYIFLALVIILFLVLGIAVVTNRSSSDSPNLPKKITATDFANKGTSSVNLTIQGALVGQDQRRAIRIKVTPTERTIYLLKGYEENIEQSKTYPNSQTAYETFLKALDNQGFGRQRVVKVTDEEGICPLGKRFIYEIISSGVAEMRSWSDSCSRNDGTFSGNATTVQKMFQRQINDYTTFTKGVKL